ncbi:MAG: sulfatase [Myxococcota bacterium]
MALCWVLIALPGCGQEGQVNPADRLDRPPNVVLITVDTLRADRLGAYGYEKAHTPAIDALAAGGVLFTDASTCIPRTTQAVASLFTSRYPHEHGVLEIGERLPHTAWTLAEQLKRAGYRTAGISANFVAGRLQGLDQGFDTFVGMGDLRSRYPIREELRKSPPAAIGKAEAVTREALRWLEEIEGEPYFLWLLYFDPHFRYDPPPPFWGRIDPAHFPFYRELATFDPKHPTIYFNLNGRSEAALAGVSALYDGEVAYTDSMISRLVTELRRRPDWNDTLIVFTADHGESLGEHGYYFEHGDLVYQATVRVPLILHQPSRLPVGRRVDGPVSLLDVFPTVLSLIGDDADRPVLSGVDLSPALDGERPDEDRVVLAESGSALFPENPRRALGGRLGAREVRRLLPRPDGPVPVSFRQLPFRYARRNPWVIVERADAEEPELYDAEADPSLRENLRTAHPEVTEELSQELDAIPVGAGRWRMARRGPWKLIRIPELGRTRFELYNVDADPMETRDLFGSRPTVETELRRVLEEWVGSIPPPPRPSPPRSPRSAIEVEERLRALGYVE